MPDLVYTLGATVCTTFMAALTTMEMLVTTTDMLSQVWLFVYNQYNQHNQHNQHCFASSFKQFITILPGYVVTLTVGLIGLIGLIGLKLKLLPQTFGWLVTENWWCWPGLGFGIGLVCCLC